LRRGVAHGFGEGAVIICKIWTSYNRAIGVNIGIRIFLAVVLTITLAGFQIHAAQAKSVRIGPWQVDTERDAITDRPTFKAYSANSAKDYIYVDCEKNNLPLLVVRNEALNTKPDAPVKGKIRFSQNPAVDVTFVGSGDPHAVGTLILPEFYELLKNADKIALEVTISEVGSIRGQYRASSAAKALKVFFDLCPIDVTREELRKIKEEVDKEKSAK
jgi:hypothetical protein